VTYPKIELHVQLEGAVYRAGVHGALCDESTTAALRRRGEGWSGA
jgi:hypothetical protein